MWFRSWIDRLAEWLQPLLPKLQSAGIVLLAGLGLAFLGRWIAQRLLRRVADEVRLLISRLVYIGIVTVATLWALVELNVYAAALTTVIGAVSLAVTLSSQDLAKNFIAGVYLLVERPFRRGDEITVRTFTGRVVSVALRTTTLRAPDEAQIIVPNTVIMSEIVTRRASTNPPGKGNAAG
jgi:small-conductance mechanosensitive channel